MALLACVDIPAMALQVLLRRHPDWSALPCAVVAEDKPGGLVLEVNEAARAGGVLPGLRYGAAQSLCRELRAEPVATDAVKEAQEDLLRLLGRFSPVVEPLGALEPGVFWLSGQGLGGLYRGGVSWAKAMLAALETEGWSSSVCVGQTRFGTYATARWQAGRSRAGGEGPTSALTVFGEPGEELTAARRVKLDRLGLEPGVREKLTRLGLRTVGELLAQPASGVQRRFGDRLWRWYQIARGDLEVPLKAHHPEEVVAASQDLDYTEDDRYRLLFGVKGMLGPLLARLAAAGERLVELHVTLVMASGARELHVLQPAEPTLDEALVLDLVRLRLEHARLDVGVVGLELELPATRTRAGQVELLAARPKRDAAAANRALARIRAEWGEEAVVRARLSEGHLPEAVFRWEPVASVAVATPVAGRPAQLVRRILDRPVGLAHRPTREPDGWLIGGLEAGPVMMTSGPYVISGGWWVREIHRDYYFLETRRGDLFWVFYDPKRRRWFLQGKVE